MALVQRLVNASFTLASGSFTESGGNKVDLTGYRISCRISKSGTVQQTMTLRIWGMSLSLMNQLSTLGMVVTLVPKNIVTVTAGDKGGAMSTIFQGTVTNAWGNFSSAPDVSFDVEATGALAYATQTIPATSYKGSSDVATIMQKLASQGDPPMTFENNGVTTKLSDQYLHGSLWSQIQECAQAAGITAVYDNGALAIIAAGKTRGGDPPLISKGTGMVGYPSYTPQGIIVSTLFTPTAKLWGTIQVQSDIKLDAETWAINGIDHLIDSMLPQGEWKSTFQCYDSKYAPQIVNP